MYMASIVPIPSVALEGRWNGWRRSGVFRIPSGDPDRGRRFIVGVEDIDHVPGIRPTVQEGFGFLAPEGQDHRVFTKFWIVGLVKQTDDLVADLFILPARFDNAPGSLPFRFT